MYDAALLAMLHQLLHFVTSVCFVDLPKKTLHQDSKDSFVLNRALLILHVLAANARRSCDRSIEDLCWTVDR
jgi:hypothetical protein